MALLILAAGCTDSDAVEEDAPYVFEAYDYEEGSVPVTLHLELEGRLDIGNLVDILKLDIPSGDIPIDLVLDATGEYEYVTERGVTVVTVGLTSASGEATTSFGTQEIGDGFLSDVGDDGVLVVRVFGDGSVDQEGPGLFSAVGLPANELWTGVDCPVLPPKESEDGRDDSEDDVWWKGVTSPSSWRSEHDVALVDRETTATSENEYHGEGDQAIFTGAMQNGVDTVVDSKGLLALFGPAIPIGSVDLVMTGLLDLTRTCTVSIPDKVLLGSTTAGVLESELSLTGAAGMFGGMVDDITLDMSFTLTMQSH